MTCLYRFSFISPIPNFLCIIVSRRYILADVKSTRYKTNYWFANVFRSPPPRCPDQRTSTTVIAIVPPPFSYYFSIVLLFVAKCIMTNLIIKSFPIWVTDLLKLFTIGHLAFGLKVFKYQENWRFLLGVLQYHYIIHLMSFNNYLLPFYYYLLPFYYYLLPFLPYFWINYCVVMNRFIQMWNFKSKFANTKRCRVVSSSVVVYFYFYLLESVIPKSLTNCCKFKLKLLYCCCLLLS